MPPPTQDPAAPSTDAASKPYTASRRQKASWATGAFADVFMANAFSYLAMPIYNIALKVDATTVGWAMGLPRVWDAIADVIVGFKSDNTRTRWGRRRPFIFVGGILCGLLFALAWMPPAQASTTVIGAYFFAISILFYTAYAIFTVPWGALGLELTDDTHERTNVQAWKNIFQAIGGVGLGTMWWLALRLGDNEVEGVRYVGVIFGLLIAACAIVPAVLCRERVQTNAHAPLSLVQAARATFTNRAFLCIIGFTLLVIMGLFMVHSLALYINIYHVFGGNKEEVSTLNMIAGGAFQLTGLAFTPLVAYAAKRLGKKSALLLGLVLVCVGFASSWWTYTPDSPYLQILSLSLISPGLACLWIIGPSMLADTCDTDAQSTGLRREGMFNASYVWSIKAGISLTLILSGYLLKWSGFDPALDQQPESILHVLRLCYAMIPVVCVAGAIACVIAYPAPKPSA
jgi:GPH family glycoside/pentoside/hexuronide:cation symporter